MKENITEQALDVVFSQSFYKGDTLIVPRPYPQSFPGFAFKAHGQKTILVNTKLPRAQRSAFLIKTMREAVYA